MEKAILVGIKLKSEKIPLTHSLPELRRLAESAGAEVVGELTQNRESPDQTYFIGSGKLEELKQLSGALDADLLIFDHEISASQTRNLEEELVLKVVDRTELILDIFAQHAKTREGRLQVLLAQNEFQMTRLTGSRLSLSRLGGGIGTRGPGETKLEMDRRRIRKKIAELKDELNDLEKHRRRARQNRKSTNIKTAALIGYTNSGKSTLLNWLTRAEVYTADRLFATLDPVTRRLYLPEGKVILLTDTVGFIQKLPHQLVEAFHATLEESIEADVLLHVVDASSPFLEEQVSAVYEVLMELKIVSKPILTVFNKIDELEDKGPLKSLIGKYHPAVMVSARDKLGGEELFKELSRLL
ncbi:GTPase HflX [Candidatus Saganbacteria bacterium]|nr:GTPase HflX [Candidatus Saganbacteria bacterium]